MREAKNGGGGGICKRFFFCFLFWRERVVILKQGGSVMLNLPHACFLLLAFSLSSPLAFILYFYPNHHFTPNHRTCLGSPPTPQTKLRIPCYPLSSKNQHKRFPLTPSLSASALLIPPPISIFLPSQPHSPFSLLKSIAHTYALPLQRPHKHPKKHPLASKKHPQNLIPKNPKISQNIWNQKLEYRP